MPVSSHRARKVIRSVSVSPGLDCHPSVIKAKFRLLPQRLFHTCCSFCLEYLPPPMCLPSREFHPPFLQDSALMTFLSSEWRLCWTSSSRHTVPHLPLLGMGPGRPSPVSDIHQQSLDLVSSLHVRPTLTQPGPCWTGQASGALFGVSGTPEPEDQTMRGPHRFS